MKIVTKLLLLCTLITPLYSDSWLPSPLQIPDTATANAGGSYFTTNSLNPGQILVTWKNNTSLLPTYTFYDTGSHTWATPEPIYNTFQSQSGTIFTCPGSGIILATFLDNHFFPRPCFATYDGSWSTPAEFSSDPYKNGTDITCSFNPNILSGTFLAVWGAGFSVTDIVFATYNTVTGWSATMELDPITKPRAGRPVYTAAGPDNFLATWGEFPPGPYSTGPYYSFLTFTGTTPTWTAPALIDPPSPTKQILGDVYCLYDPTSNRFLATWVDQSTNLPLYSFYSGTSWDPPQSIANEPSFGDVITSIDPVSGKILATWPNFDVSSIYSIYDGTSWSPFGTSNTIPNADNTAFTSQAPLSSSYDATNNQFIVTWNVFAQGNGIYDILNLAPQQTTTTVVTFPNPSAFTRTIIIRATVTSGTTPTGIVVFKAGNKTLGRASLVNGVARIKTCQLPRGTTTITAYFLGNALFAPSSGTTTQTVF